MDKTKIFLFYKDQIVKLKKEIGTKYNGKIIGSELKYTHFYKNKNIFKLKII